MAVVKIDEKGRVQLPKILRNKMNIKPRQPLRIDMEGGKLVLTSSPLSLGSSDPLIRDITQRPLKLKNIKLTKALLDRIEEEQWSQ